MPTLDKYKSNLGENVNAFEGHYACLLRANLATDKL